MDDAAAPNHLALLDSCIQPYPVRERKKAVFYSVIEKTQIKLSDLRSSIIYEPQKVSPIPKSLPIQGMDEDKKIQLLLNAGGPDKVSRVQMAKAVAQFKGHDTSKIKPVSASLQLDEYVQSHFLIDHDDDEFFWRAFKYRTSKRFSQIMSDIHEGVDTTHEWLIPAYKKLGRTPTHEEVFKETQTLKSDKSKWVDKRSQDTHVRYSINEKFIKKLAEVQAQHAEVQAQGMELQPIDEDLIWEEVCGGQKKNRVYEKESFFSSSIKSGTTSANSSTKNQNFVPDLREQIHNLNEEIFQCVTQQTDERISKLLDTRLAPLEKTQKKLEKLERTIGKAKKEKLKQKRWNEAYVS
ncbi:hypothetical protein Ahy_B02g061073 [Arachis hypogaea]|uniref:Uncharacterized protein n=1 Tax=Arachis hypogaea TaxID=3818 RepID=A0A445AK17_ARAHY|nr:hypothetical protein Ahy_B02g061073 [Arachis hypogaea]